MAAGGAQEERSDGCSFRTSLGRAKRVLQLTAFNSSLRSSPILAPRTYCEVGFNGGHSAASVLAARPGVDVLSFDLAVFPYSNSTAKLLSDLYMERFKLVRGDSTTTIPAYVESMKRSGNPVTCDVMFIDGGHMKEVFLADLGNFRNLLSNRSRNRVFFDDSHDCNDVRCRINTMGGCFGKFTKFFASQVSGAGWAGAKDGWAGAKDGWAGATTVYCIAQKLTTFCPSIRSSRRSAMFSKRWRERGRYPNL